MKKILFIVAMFFFVGTATTYAQDEGGGKSIRTSNNNSNSTSSDDLAKLIVKRINACESVNCLVTLYNKMAKVAKDFKNYDAGLKFMAAVLELMDKKQDGVLFDVYMSKNNIYQKYFIEVAKKLPEDIRNEMVRKANNYQKN